MRRAGRAVLVLLAVAVGCERSRDRAAEVVVEKAIEAHGREAQVAIDSANGTITVTLGGAVRPRDWPDSVPLYPHAQRAAADRGPAGARALTLATDDTRSDLASFYRAELAKKGWQIVNAEDSGREWTATRRSETLRLSFRSQGRGSRAELEYQVSS
jgi:hypothetical protein